MHPVPLDFNLPAYLDNMSLRMLAVESSAIQERRECVRRLSTINSLSGLYASQVSEVKQDLLLAKRSIEQSQRIFDMVVLRWRETARKSDLERMHARLDEIPFELLATQKDLRNL